MEPVQRNSRRKTRSLLRPSVRLYVPTRHIHPIGVTFEIEPWHAAPSRTIEPHFNIMQSECNEAIHGESQPRCLKNGRGFRNLPCKERVVFLLLELLMTSDIQIV